MDLSIGILIHASQSISDAQIGEGQVRQLKLQFLKVRQMLN